MGGGSVRRGTATAPHLAPGAEIDAGLVSPFVTNPHLLAWRRQVGNRRRVEGWSAAAGTLAALGLVVAAGPVLRPVLFGFLEVADAVPEGVGAVAMRLGVVNCGAMALFTYGAAVRTEDRRVLDLHPMRPEALTAYVLLRTAADRLPWLVASALVLLPVLLEGHVAAWALGAGVAAGGWLAGLGLGLPVNLGAVRAADAPALQGFLDAVRGSNPRAQAALLYAPGVVLAVGGLAVGLAADGATAVLRGHPAEAWRLGVPVLAGVVGLALSRRAVTLAWVQATPLLAEIDAAWLRVDDPEEARRVALEGAVRWLSPNLRPLVLKELRHGWRGHRGWISGAWGLGAVAALAAWSGDVGAVARAGALGTAGLVLVGGVGVRLATADPVWLDTWLELRGPRPLLARALAVFGWAQAVVAPATLAAAVRHGVGASLGLFGGLELAAVLMAVLAAAVGPLRGRGWSAYVPAGLAIWTLLTLGVWS